MIDASLQEQSLREYRPKKLFRQVRGLLKGQDLLISGVDDSVYVPVPTAVRNMLTR